MGFDLSKLFIVLAIGIILLGPARLTRLAMLFINVFKSVRVERPRLSEQMPSGEE